jgi:hypothetical protein
MDTMYDSITLVVLIVMTLLLGILIIFFITRIFSFLFIRSKKMKFLEEDNVSATILLVSILISVALLCSETIMTVQQNLHISAQMPVSERAPYVLQTAGLGLIQLVLAVIISLGITFIATRLFDLLTKGIKEFKLIAESKNISAGLLLGGMVIALTLFIKFTFSVLVSKLIPLPQYGIPI